MQETFELPKKRKGPNKFSMRLLSCGSYSVEASHKGNRFPSALVTDVEDCVELGLPSLSILGTGRVIAGVPSPVGPF